MTISPEDILKLLLSILAGGSIGLERELHHKAAGFRTIILICLGATLFTMLDKDMQGSGRIAANIVTGVGFLGAGVILHEENRVRGLTTSASVWLAAALGMAIGNGAYLLTAAAVLIVMIVMRFFVGVERRFDNLWDSRLYRISLSLDSLKFDWVEKEMHECGLKVSSIQRMKQNGQMICQWSAAGSTKNHKAFIDLVINDPEINDISW